MSPIAKSAALALLITGAVGTAHAEVFGSVSHIETGGVRVGPAAYPPGSHGRPGVGVDGQLRNAHAAATHFANTEYRDAKGVYSYSGRQLVENGAPGPGQRGDHSKLGVWSFAQAGNLDVWFGEWSAEVPTGATGSKTPGTHTVWYVGENNDVAATLPLAEPVRYTIRSINNYTGGALPVSTLTANFSTGVASASGDIGFREGAIRTVGKDVRLAASGVSVASSGGSGGNLDGRFFGTGAAGVAGIVKFADRNRDTAFGGIKAH